jgi:hypothetical protein
MAITITSSPAPYSSMHENLWFVSSSTNSGTTNFKFVYDVFINGSQVIRSKVFPAPSAEGSYGVFDAAPIVRSSVTNYFEPSGNSILVGSNDKIKVDYEVRIGEEVSGVTTTNLASGSYSAYNFVPPLFADVFFMESQTYLDLATYYSSLQLENFKDNFLTERDLDNIAIEYGDNFYASYLKITAGTYSAFVEVVNESEAVTSTVSGNITLTGQFNLFNLEASHINTFAGSTIINANTYGYNFYLKRGSTQSRVIKLRQKCYPKFQQYNLEFLNRLGGWETKSFTLVNKRSSDFERTSYRRNDWQLVGGQMKNSDGYNKFNETTFNYAIQHKDKYRLTSDWVTEQDYAWLAQLVSSPIVYMEVLGAYFPVTISQTNYEYKLESADKLFNFEIEIEVGRYLTSQFR